MKEIEGLMFEWQLIRFVFVFKLDYRIAYNAHALYKLFSRKNREKVVTRSITGIGSHAHHAKRYFNSKNTFPYAYVPLLTKRLSNWITW